MGARVSIWLEKGVFGNHIGRFGVELDEGSDQSEGQTITGIIKARWREDLGRGQR